MRLSDFPTQVSFINFILSIPDTNLIDRDYVFSLLANTNNKYSKAALPKKTGGTRIIDIPSPDLKLIQNIIKNLILEDLSENYFTFPSFVTAFIKGRGIFDNAQIHRNKKYILHVDIEDFFGSIHFGRVSGLLRSNLFNLTGPMSFFFADILTLNGKLPQGAPSSPIISNLIGLKLDKRLLRLSSKHHFTYSRYADDLIFSTNDSKDIENKLTNFISSVVDNVISSGFNINWNKINVMGPDVRHTVTGLSNNKRVSTTSNFYKTTRAMAHHFYTTNSIIVDNISYYGLTQKDRDKALHIIQGRLSFINDIEQKNKSLHTHNYSSIEYQAITPYSYKTYNTKVPDGPINNDNVIQKTNFNAKENSFRRFYFFQLFLYGSTPTIITEGITDPIYINAALKSKNRSYKYRVTSTQYLQKNSDVFHEFFNIAQGGPNLIYVLQTLLDKQFNPDIINYFDRNLFPLKPVIILYDHELENRSKPLLQAIGKICKLYPDHTKETIIKNLKNVGYMHIDKNVFIATTFHSRNDYNEYAIEDYFPDDFLADVNGNNSQHFKKNTLTSDTSVPISKGDLADKVSSSLINQNIFNDFDTLFAIFETINRDYLSMLIDKLSDKTPLMTRTLYNILNDENLCLKLTDYELSDKLDCKFLNVFGS